LDGVDRNDNFFTFSCWEINGGLNSQVLPSLKYDTLTEFLNAYLFEIDASLQIKTNTILALMIKYIVMGLRGFFLLAAKIWSFICYCFKRQARAVSDIHNKSPESKTMIYIFHLPRYVCLFLHAIGSILFLFYPTDTIFLLFTL
jgi:hypothetical protein